MVVQVGVGFLVLSYLGPTVSRSFFPDRFVVVMDFYLLVLSGNKQENPIFSYDLWSMTCTQKTLLKIETYIHITPTPQILRGRKQMLTRPRILSKLQAETQKEVSSKPA